MAGLRTFASLVALASLALAISGCASLEARRPRSTEQTLADQLRDIERRNALHELWRGSTPPLQ